MSPVYIPKENLPDDSPHVKLDIEYMPLVDLELPYEFPICRIAQVPDFDGHVVASAYEAFRRCVVSECADEQGMP